jgi:hypothetical protein
VLAWATNGENLADFRPRFTRKQVVEGQAGAGEGQEPIPAFFPSGARTGRSPSINDELIARRPTGRGSRSDAHGHAWTGHGRARPHEGRVPSAPKPSDWRGRRYPRSHSRPDRASRREQRNRARQTRTNLNGERDAKFSTALVSIAPLVQRYAQSLSQTKHVAGSGSDQIVAARGVSAS